MPHPNQFTPAVLMHPLRLLERKRGGLRPDFIAARSHLVDIAEIYLQFHATATIALLATAPRTVSDSFKTRFLEFLNTKLNAGHWLGTWKRAAKLVTDDPDAQRSPLAVFARLPFDTLPDGQSVLSRLDALPSLRNQKRGHSYTPDPDSARADIDSAWPLIESLLDTSQPLFEQFALCACVAAEAGVAELADLSGVALASEVASTHLVELEGLLTTEDIVLIHRASLGTGSVLPADFVKLGPLFYCSDNGLAIYQGPNGESSSRFMSIADASCFDIPAATVRHALGSLLPATVGVSRKRHQPPAWATQLTRHDLLTEAEYRDQDAHPTSFFRGNVASWGDLAHGLDIRRRLKGPDGDIDSHFFDETTLPRLLERARNGESPVVVFLGPAGTGKTTQLHRTAFELHRRFPSDVVVLRHHTGWDPELSDIALAHEANPQAVLAIAFDEAGPRAQHIDGLRRNLQVKRIPAILLCAERTNLWPTIPADRYEMPAELTRREADEIINRLETYNLLGALGTITREQQVERLICAWDGQLLVALREATEGRRFDEIIESEYRTIPTPEGRDVYLAAAIMHRSGLMLPMEVAMAIGRCTEPRAFRDVQRACQGALVVESSRYHKFCRTRHRRIAEVLCARVVLSRDDMIEEVGHIVGHLSATRENGPRDTSDNYLAAKLLGSAEVEAVIAEGPTSAVIQHLTGLRDADRIVHNALHLTQWSKGTVRIAAAWISRGLHVAGKQWAYQTLSKLFHAIARHEGVETAIAFAQTTLDASLVSDDRTDHLAHECMHALKHSDLPAAITFMRQQIDRALPIRVPHWLYIRLSELLGSANNHEQALATAQEGLDRLGDPPSAEASRLFAVACDAKAALGAVDDALTTARIGLECVRSAVDCKRTTHELWTRIIKLESERGRYTPAIQAARAGLEECSLLGEAGARQVWVAIIRACARASSESVPHAAQAVMDLGQLLDGADALTIVELATVFARKADLQMCNYLLDLALAKPIDDNVAQLIRRACIHVNAVCDQAPLRSHILGRVIPRLMSAGIDIAMLTSEHSLTCVTAGEIQLTSTQYGDIGDNMAGTDMPLIQFGIYVDPLDPYSLLTTLLDGSSAVLLFTQRVKAEEYAAQTRDLSSSAAVGIVEIALLPEILDRASGNGHTHVAVDYEPKHSSPQLLTISDFVSYLRH